MKRVLENHGQERVAVLMLDVSHAPGTDIALPTRRAEKFFERIEVDWPRVVVPGGVTTVMHRLNKSGYGILLVDPAGRVHSTDISAHELDAAIRTWHRDDGSDPSEPSPSKQR